MNNILWVNSNVGSAKKSSAYRLSFFPRRCNSSGKKLWFKYAYRISYKYYGYNGEAITETRWYDKKEYIILRLKG